jgi:hypothetical protein
VVASQIGGIPEVGGDAAVLLPASAPPERWVAEVDRLLGDPAWQGEVASRSRANAARPQLQPAAILESFLRLAGRHDPAE